MKQRQRQQKLTKIKEDIQRQTRTNRKKGVDQFKRNMKTNAHKRRFLSQRIYYEHTNSTFIAHLPGDK